MAEPSGKFQQGSTAAPAADSPVFMSRTRPGQVILGSSLVVVGLKSRLRGVDRFLGVYSRSCPPCATRFLSARSTCSAP